MKSLFRLLTSFLFLSVLFLTPSCEKEKTQEEQPPVPVLKVKLPAPLEYFGGDLVIDYEVSDPVEGGVLKVEVSKDAVWISDIVISDNKVSAKVGTNYAADSRTADMLFSYPDAEPVKVEVQQNALIPAFTIDVKTANVKDVLADIEFAPSDEAALYYATVLDSQGYETASADWAEYVYSYYSDLIVGSLDLETVVRTMANQGKQTLQAKNLSPKTVYYACAVGVDIKARLTTEVKVLSFTTLEEFKTDYGFDIAISDITSRGATVQITPKDKSANYYWNVMSEPEYEKYKDNQESLSKWFQEKMAADRLSEWGEYADLFGSVSEYIYGQCTHLGASDNYTYKTLDPASEYRVYAFWVDEMTGEVSSETTWSEPFVTKEKTISSGTMDISAVVTDGDNWKEIAPNQRYDYLAGTAVLGFRINPGEGVSEWYANIYDEETVGKFSEDELVSSVMLKGRKNLKEYFVVNQGFAWGGNYFVLGVAVDADGNNTRLMKVPFKVDKSLAEKLTELPEGY